MHLKLLFTVYIFAFFRMCDSITAEQCPAQDPIYWKALKGYTFKILKGSSPFGCLYHCHYEVRCQSYNYVIKNDICEMNNRTQEANPDQFVSDPDRFYMKRGAHRVALGSTPSLPAESCQEIQANEAGEAVSGNSWLDPTGSGEVILAHCDMDTEVANFCIRNRCRNGGSCVNGHVNYTCLCDGLWTGTYCEKAIPDKQTTSTLASDTQTISTLPYDTQTIPTLASDSQTISTQLASDIQTISTLASDTQTVSTTASDTQTISTLVSDTQTISTLASDTQTISTLASDTQTISTLASDTQTTAIPAPTTQSSTAEPGFRVTVVTGTAAGAGTDARLFLQLVGTHGGKSGWTEVATEPGGYKPDFEFGMADTFTVVFQDVGIISSLEIDLVSTGAWYEGWTVDKFTIEDPGRDMTYTFNGPLNVYPGDDPHVLSAS